MKPFTEWHFDAQQYTYRRIARLAPKSLHGPISEEQPLPAADILARLIAEIDRQDDGGPVLYLEFGGAGDNGEFLIGCMDVLLKLGIIAYSEEALLKATGLPPLRRHY